MDTISDITNTPFAPNEAGRSASLDGVVTDLIALGLLAKQAHWNVEGPTFRSVHSLLDDTAALARDAGDRVAERAVTLGHHPDGRPETVAAGHTLKVFDSGAIRDHEAITLFIDILAAVGVRLHEAINTFDDDPVTQDLLTEVSGELEKRAWMVRAHR